MQLAFIFDFRLEPCLSVGIELLDQRADQPRAFHPEYVFRIGEIGVGKYDFASERLENAGLGLHGALDFRIDGQAWQSIRKRNPRPSKIALQRTRRTASR